MVNDAEKFKADDEKIKARVEAKNGLENYCYSMKNTLSEENLKDKFTDDDKKTIEDATKDALQWMEGNENADATEFENKKKELEAKLSPIMMRVYQAAGGAPGAGGMPGGMPGGGMPGAGDAGAPGADSGVNDLD